MISVVIPTLNSERDLGPALAALIPAAVDGLVRDVVIADGGSTDRTLKIAEGSGAEIVTARRGRGFQLAAGAERAKCAWLLFLHADSVLQAGWETSAETFIARSERGDPKAGAAAFQFALDDTGLAPRLLEHLVALRSRFLKLPYGDQGLLISRRLYEAVGGFAQVPIMEDVDLVRRLGRKRITILDAKALTSPERFRRDGYLRRSAKNLLCLSLYYWGFPLERIERIYTGRRA
jgi:rSAM/selenodomain-associated transferase 2